jgi:hypothetical protein
MNSTNIIVGIIISLLLLYLFNNINTKNKNNKISTKLYNPFIITKNQTRQIEKSNQLKGYKIKDDKWISDDLMTKRCYNLCQSNYLQDYKTCIKTCDIYEKF